MGTEDLIEANHDLLRQAQRLLSGLNDHEYAAPDGGLYSASIGQHFRHCLDHYTSFLKGLPEGAINYDQRERSGNFECLTDCALDEIKDVQRRLLGTAREEVGRSVKVKMDCGAGSNEWQISTMGRELQFLVSHTIHHFAMIHGMGQRRGIEIEEGLGVAPSTLKHHEVSNID